MRITTCLIAVGFNTQQFGQFLPAVPEWGIPPFSGGNQAYEIISTGSVVLDLISTSAKRIVWRGIAQAEIDSEKTDEQRHARIREGDPRSGAEIPQAEVSKTVRTRAIRALIGR